MTLCGRPRSMASSKARRSASRIAEASIRASSTTRSVSWAFSAKCLIVEMMRLSCTPAIASPAITPVSSGSSEKYSKFRPFARVSDQVCGASEQHIEALGARRGPDRATLLARQSRVPGRGERQVRGHGDSGVVRADMARIGDPEFRVGFLQRRYSEARHAGNEACGAHGLRRLRLAAPGGAEASMHQGDLLGLRHDCEHERRTAVRRQRNVVPTACGLSKRHPGAQARQQQQTQQPGGPGTRLHARYSKPEIGAHPVPATDRPLRTMLWLVQAYQLCLPLVFNEGRVVEGGTIGDLRRQGDCSRRCGSSRPRGFQATNS